MTHLQQIQDMYALMSETGRTFLAGMAGQLLRSFPKDGASTSLAATKNACKVELIDHDSNCTVYKFPLSSVGQSVHRKKADIG